LRPDPYAWSLHAEATASIVLLCVAYVIALRRYPAPHRRIGCFALAAALLLATAVTPLNGLSYHLLSAHLLQNVVLAEWAPGLLVLAVPPALAAELARLGPLRFLTRPFVALPLWLLTYFLWHLPTAYDAALERPALLHVEHASYLAAGFLLWWPVLQDAPWRLPSGVRAGYLFGAFLLGSPLGLLLALLPEPVYGYYEDAPRLWGLSALADQQIAGATMSAEQAIVFFAAFTVFFLRFFREEEARETGP
jgi:putative membrane protein